MKLKISIEKKDSKAYLLKLAQVDLPSRKATLLRLARTIERIKGLCCEISQGASNAAPVAPKAAPAAKPGSTSDILAAIRAQGAKGGAAPAAEAPKAAAAAPKSAAAEPGSTSDILAAIRAGKGGASTGKNLDELADSLMAGLTDLLEDYHLSSELSLKAVELLTGSPFWENQNVKPIWLPDILYYRSIPEGFGRNCEVWDSVDEWVIGRVEIFIPDTAALVFLQQLENRIMPEILSFEDRLFNGKLKPSFDDVYGTYAYCGAFYSVENTGTLDDEEVGLLLMEHVDKERVKFERLRRKFTSSEILEVAAVRERISEEVRIAVWRRDGGKCARCGSRERLEYDHIIPVSKGGGNVVRNIELLCERCNRSKGAEIR